MTAADLLHGLTDAKNGRPLTWPTLIDGQPCTIGHALTVLGYVTGNQTDGAGCVLTARGRDLLDLIEFGARVTLAELYFAKTTGRIH